MAVDILHRLCQGKELPDWLGLAQVCDVSRQHGRAAFFCKLHIAQEMPKCDSEVEAAYMLRFCAEMLKQDLESKQGQGNDFTEVLQWHCYLARCSTHSIEDRAPFFPSALQRLGQLIQRCIHSQQADQLSMLRGYDPFLVCIGAYMASAQQAGTDQTVLDWLQVYIPVVDEAAQAWTAFLENKFMTQGTVDTPLATHIQLCCQERQSQSLAVCMPAWAQHSHEQLFRQAVAFVSLADFMNSMKAGTETLALLSAADEIFQILVKRSDEINQAAMGVCVDELVHMGQAWQNHRMFARAVHCFVQASDYIAVHFPNVDAGQRLQLGTAGGVMKLRQQQDMKHVTLHNGSQVVISWRQATAIVEGALFPESGECSPSGKQAALIMLARIATAKCNFAIAKASCIKALTVVIPWNKQRSLESGPHQLAEAHAILAEAYAALGEVDDASAHIATATAMLKSQTDQAVPDEAWLHLQAIQLEVCVYNGDTDSILAQLQACRIAVQQGFTNDLGSIRQASCAAHEAYNSVTIVMIYLWCIHDCNSLHSVTMLR
ncbi:hypothetical protein ABBQ38_000365 [Trebouxia sp. C0009 RCD-2024]